MGAIKKLFKGLKGKRPGAGSQAVTGIAPGDGGTNRPGAYPPKNRRPGRRGADTPLGPGANRM